MRLKRVILKNFKAFEKSEIDFDDISVIVGRNDAGKSTILHALNLFFNPKETKKTDLFFKNEEGFADSLSIECHFSFEEDDEINLGGEDKDILITETNLLNEERLFVFGYTYTENSLKKSPFISTSYINCYNYNISGFDWSSGKKTLEEMNKKDLDAAIKNLEISKPEDADGRENHWKRKSLESYLISQNHNKTEVQIEFEEKKEARLKPVIERLPQFKLFSNDKANSIEDKENSAVIENEIKSIIADQMKSKLNEINDEMHKAMQEKLQSLNDAYHHFFGFLGNDNFKLKDGTPKIDFKTNGIVDSKEISIENRGSGFRRLALLSLHLSSHQEEEYKNIIFAIEEPETSQNPHNQKGIIEAIQKLNNKGSQIIITTHSPSMAKEFDDSRLNYVLIENDGKKSSVKEFDNKDLMFEDIIETLGILPLDIVGKKLIVFVEGIDEQILLKKINQDIIKDNEILFIAGGGNSIHFHIACKYFDNKLKLMVLVDKNYDSKNVKDELQKIYPSICHTEYFIESTKEDITLYWKLDQEQDMYYQSDKLKSDGSIRYKKGDYNRERKGQVSAHFKKNLLNNSQTVDKNGFYEWNEIQDWFNKFSKWKSVE